MAELAGFGIDWMCGIGIQGNHSSSNHSKFGYLQEETFNSSNKKNMPFYLLEICF